MAEVHGGELVAYANASTEGNISDRVAEGRVVWVDSREEVGGEIWLRIQFASVAWDGQDVFAWTPSTDRLREVTLACPETAEVATLGGMTAQELLNCYGDGDLTLLGFAVEVDPPELAYTGTPSWIAEPSSMGLRGSDEETADTGLLAIHVDPAIGLDIPRDEWLEVRGHFDDPAASDCRREPADTSLSDESMSEQTHYCQQRFVVEHVRIVERPVFPTPAPDATNRRPGRIGG